jgi:dolichol-phosphate mannosyltransferase
MKLTIVSPTYNEAANVARLANEVDLALHGMDYELLIADDDSPDRTWFIAQELSKSSPQVRVIRRLKNRGLSAAVLDGFLSSTSECVAVIDADLQHDPSILPAMLKAIDEGGDVVVGSRYVSGGGTGSWNAIRRIESWVATKLAQIFLGVALKDPMSGYFMLRRKDFELVREQLDTTGFKILLEIVARLGPSKLKEVPYTFRSRQAGESKLSSKVVLQYIAQLWRLSSVSRYMSVRFIKFAIVGASGTAINLCAFLIISQLSGLRDWRISGLASLVANITNYVFNNAWTFVDQGHRGYSLARGYVSYLVMSSVGLLVSMASFAGLSHAFRAMLSAPAATPGVKSLALGIQLISILIGTFFNYELNKRFTWRGQPHKSDPGTLSPQKNQV